MPAKPVCLAAAAPAKPLEGLCLTADLCPAGVPTLGFGHTGPVVRLGMASPRRAGRAVAGSRPDGRCGPRRMSASRCRRLRAERCRPSPSTWAPGRSLVTPPVPCRSSASGDGKRDGSGDGRDGEEDAVRPRRTSVGRGGTAPGTGPEAGRRAVSDATSRRRPDRFRRQPHPPHPGHRRGEGRRPLRAGHQGPGGRVAAGRTS